MAEHAQTPNESEQTVVYSGKGSMSFKKKLVIGLLVLVGIFSATLGLLWWQQQSQPAFVINGREYSRDEYNQMMASAEAAGVSKKDATKQYIDIEKKRAAAEQLNIKPTPNSLMIAEANLNIDAMNDQASLWLDELAYEAALDPAIDFLKTKGYAGVILYFPFLGTAEQVYGEKKVSVSDAKKNALEKAKAYKRQLASGDDVTQIVEEISTNPAFILDGAGNRSGVFNIDTKGEEVLGSGISQLGNSKDLLPVVKKLKDGEVSEIITGKVKTQTSTIESYYYIVRLDLASKGDKNIETTFSNILKDIEVESNV